MRKNRYEFGANDDKTTQESQNMRKQRFLKNEYKWETSVGPKSDQYETCDAT